VPATVLYTRNELTRLGLSKVTALQTERYTDIHVQTYRQTHRQTGATKHTTTATFAGGNNVVIKSIMVSEVSGH